MKLLLAVVASLVATSAALPTRHEGRISGGHNARAGDYPWQLTVREWLDVNLLTYCGGALIGDHWGLTSASCCDSVLPIVSTVVVGDLYAHLDDGTEQHIEVRETHIHPAFNKNTLENDICIIEVQRLSY